MAKQSFFSRLMGSDIVDESEEARITNFSFQDEEEQEEETMYAPEPPKHNFKEELRDEDFQVSEIETPEDNWMPESEYEGQLAVDVFQTRDDVVIQTIVAGVNPDDVDITIANDKVTIEGERRRASDTPIEDYFYQECYWGSFSRSVILPVDVDVDNVEAKIKDGILTINLPKAAKAKVRKVQIKS